MAEKRKREDGEDTDQWSPDVNLRNGNQVTMSTDVNLRNTRDGFVHEGQLTKRAFAAFSDPRCVL